MIQRHCASKHREGVQGKCFRGLTSMRLANFGIVLHAAGLIQVNGINSLLAFKKIVLQSILFYFNNLITSTK